jgi:glycosyltransferase involved in cell wall biosynthesis
VDDAWAIRVENRYWLGGRLVWQPWAPLFRASELIIAEHANSLALTHRLVWRRSMGGGGKLAFWGHGANLQRERSVGAGYKRWIAQQVDWWFAYTQSSAALIASTGFPSERITVVNNSIDTTAIVNTRERIADRDRVRRELGILGQNIGIYCGGMYEEKRLDFLVAACQLIRREIGDFELLVIGSGPTQGIVETAAEQHRWIHYIGPRFGSALAPYLSAARVYLMPGVAGLAIIDSFAASVPMITTSISTHGPELFYLKNGENGLITNNTLQAYVDGVCGLFRNSARLQHLQAGCNRAAQVYTLDAMAARYAEGVDQCLAI